VTKVDAGIVAAFIGAVAAIAVVVVTAVFGLYTYPRQKAVDRKEDLRKGREKAYAEYLAAYAEAERWNGVAGKEKEFDKALRTYSQKYSTLFNLADNNVLKPTSEFHEFLYTDTSNLPPDEWAQEWIRLYTEVLIQMRKDAFVGESTVSKEEIAKRLPWYFEWQPETKAQESSLRGTVTSQEAP
jgi:hypothetical protein